MVIFDVHVSHLDGRPLESTTLPFFSATKAQEWCEASVGEAWDVKGEVYKIVGARMIVAPIFGIYVTVGARL